MVRGGDWEISCGSCLGWGGGGEGGGGGGGCSWPSSLLWDFGVNLGRCLEWKFFHFETLIFVGVMQGKIIEPMSVRWVLGVSGYFLGFGVLGTFGFLGGGSGIARVKSNKCFTR